METEKKRIGVLLGGMSSEKEVSLNSGRNVFQHIPNNKYERVPIFMDEKGGFWEITLPLIVQNKCVDIEDRLETEAKKLKYEELAERVDFMIIALHGKYGEDGCVQGLLELLDIPYSNSGVLASALGMNKYYQKKILDLHEVNDVSIKERLIYKSDFEADKEKMIAEIELEFEYPFIVKPNREGSSSGVSKVDSREEIEKAFAAAFEFDNEIFIEEFLNGLEFSVIVIDHQEGTKALLPTEIVTENAIFTYEDKYMPGGSQKITPARVNEEMLKKMQEKAVLTHKVLGFEGYSRIDGFIVNEKDVVITDPNSSSTMAPSSFLLHQAAEEGMTARDFLQMLIDYKLN